MEENEAVDSADLGNPGDDTTDENAEKIKRILDGESLYEELASPSSRVDSVDIETGPVPNGVVRVHVYLNELEAQTIAVEQSSISDLDRVVEAEDGGTPLTEALGTGKVTNALIAAFNDGFDIENDDTEDDVMDLFATEDFTAAAGKIETVDETGGYPYVTFELNFRYPTSAILNLTDS